MVVTGCCGTAPKGAHGLGQHPNPVARPLTNWTEVTLLIWEVITKCCGKGAAMESVPGPINQAEVLNKANKPSNIGFEGQESITECSESGAAIELSH